MRKYLYKGELLLYALLQQLHFMRKYLYVGLGCTLISVGIHFYLAKRSYELKAGSAEHSQICSISEKINCDSALLSSYGEIFGISLSNFGLAFNLMLALILLGILWRWIGEFWKSFSIYTAIFIALASLVMMALSLFEKLYCPLCWTSYILSYIGFFAIYKAFKDQRKLNLSFIADALKDRRSWIFAGGIPAVAFFLHMSFVTGLGLKDIEENVKMSLIDWRREEVFHFKAPSPLTSGPKESFMNVVEFVDFLCPHCKNIQPSMEKFLENYPEASFVFYVYPLDAQCNRKIPFSNDGLSCELAKLFFCAKQQNENIKIHDLIFKRQSQFLQKSGNLEEIQKIKDLIIEEAELQKDSLMECLKNNETEELLKQHIEEGINANISGTPSIFVNGKQLRGGHTPQTLQTLYMELKNNKTQE